MPGGEGLQALCRFVLQMLSWLMNKPYHVYFSTSFGGPLLEILPTMKSIKGIPMNIIQGTNERVKMKVL
jgi:hypothetical protein